MSDYRDSVKKAIGNYIAKQAEANRPKTEHRKNASPEREVQHAVTAWMKAQGWDYQVVESKAQLVGGRWVNAAVKAGTSDIIATTPQGFSASVELKAPGKRASFWRQGNERQVDFILNKIDRNGFACVVDSADMLEKLFSLWLKSRDQSPGVAQQVLRDALPKKPKRTSADDVSLFD